MPLLPLNVVYEGYSQFFMEEKFVLTVLTTFSWGALYFLGLLSPSTALYAGIAVIVIRKFIAGGFCCNSDRLDGQTILITGANAGIGKTTSIELAKRGANLILACRDMKKGNAAVKEIKQLANTVVVCEQLDLTHFKSIKEFADKIKSNYDKIDMLINNAGVMACPYMKTKDGLELQIGTNHFGHFALTKHLLPLLTKGHPARIINLSSEAHHGGRIPYGDFSYNNGYAKFPAYRNSKIANILHIRYLAKMLKGTNVQVFAVHPGAVESELLRYAPLGIGHVASRVAKFAIKSRFEGAQTTLYCATRAKSVDPYYYSDSGFCVPDKYATCDDNAKRLYEETDKIINELSK